MPLKVPVLRMESKARAALYVAQPEVPAVRRAQISEPAEVEALRAVEAAVVAAQRVQAVAAVRHAREEAEALRAAEGAAVAVRRAEAVAGEEPLDVEVVGAALPDAVEAAAVRHVAAAVQVQPSAAA